MIHLRFIRLVCAMIVALTVVPRAAAAAQPAVAVPFQNYYKQQDGLRVLGYPRAGLDTADGFYAQYFEKGRIEYHPEIQSNKAWQFAYGRLAALLIEQGASLPIGGETSSARYRDLQAEAAPERRLAAPRPTTNGPVDAGARGVFVPVNPQLAAGPGHYVARPFWNYINQASLFPGGWLHDIGLPLTEAMSANVTKGGQQRTITIQAFERTILTNDPRNPAAFQIERANVGSDYLVAFPLGAEDAAIRGALPAPVGGMSYSSYIQFVDGAYARVFLEPQHSQPGNAVVDPAWVFLRKEATGWKLIGGPGTAFDNNFYSAERIPTTMRVGSELEIALNKAVSDYIPRQSGEQITIDLIRIAGGFARVRVNAVNFVADPNPATLYARLDNVNQWTVIVPPGPPPGQEILDNLGIPKVLYQ